MVDAKGGSRRWAGSGTGRIPVQRDVDTNIDRVDFSVVRGRDEAQIIFMADELSDLHKNFGEILAGFREVGAASIGMRDGP